MNKRFKILSIDGGGARGIYPAHILKRIKEQFSIDFINEFDIITGTSTGAIIAAALAVDIPIESVCIMYENLVNEIFNENKFAFGGFAKSKYNTDKLEKILKSNFKNFKMKEAKTTLIIPATDIGNGKVYVHKTPYRPEFVRDGDTLIRDAILSSCSAPIYFSPSMIKNGADESYLLADGGLWANNPSLLAVIEALNPKRLNKKLDDIKILSLGTGISKKTYDFKDRNWGLKDWDLGLGLVNLILGLQSQNPDNMLSLLLNDEQYLRINFESESDLPLDVYREEFKSKAGDSFTYNAEKIRKFFEEE